MHHLNMLEVIEAGKPSKRYVNGRRVSNTRWDLIHVHSSGKDSFSTVGKNGKWYHRHVARTPNWIR